MEPDGRRIFTDLRLASGGAKRRVEEKEPDGAGTDGDDVITKSS